VPPSCASILPKLGARRHLRQTIQQHSLHISCWHHQVSIGNEDKDLTWLNCRVWPDWLASDSYYSIVDPSGGGWPAAPRQCYGRCQGGRDPSVPPGQPGCICPRIWSSSAFRSHVSMDECNCWSQLRPLALLDLDPPPVARPVHVCARRNWRRRRPLASSWSCRSHARLYGLPIRLAVHQLRPLPLVHANSIYMYVQTIRIGGCNVVYYTIYIRILAV
jgi:hypothetical protein